MVSVRLCVRACVSECVLRTYACIYIYCAFLWLRRSRRITQFSSGKQPKQTDRIVYIVGSFDMFHKGKARQAPTNPPLVPSTHE